MIDWAKIQEKGEAGLLTARETDALVKMAKASSPWGLDGRCRWCRVAVAWKWGPAQHLGDCPLAVLGSKEQEAKDADG